MLLETKIKLASWVMLCDKFTKGDNNPFKRVEPYKNSLAIEGQLGGEKWWLYKEEDWDNVHRM